GHAVPELERAGRRESVPRGQRLARLLEVEGIVAVPDDAVRVALREADRDLDGEADERRMIRTRPAHGATAPSAASSTAHRKLPPAPKEFTSARRGSPDAAKGPSGSSSARLAATSCPAPAAAVSPIAGFTRISGGTGSKTDRIASSSAVSISATPSRDG